MSERITKKHVEAKFNRLKQQAETDGYDVSQWELFQGSELQGSGYRFKYGESIHLYLGKTAKQAFESLSNILDGWCLRGLTDKAPRIKEDPEVTEALKGLRKKLYN